MADFPLEFLLQVKNEMGSGISQATSQLKSMGSEAQSAGSKVKQSGIGIGAGLSLITMNLVNTANSIIGLNRQWQDLTRKQNDVVQSDNQLLNKKNLLATSYNKLQAAMNGTEGASERQKQIAIDQFKLDMKNAKTNLDVLKAKEALGKVMDKGGKDLNKIANLTRTYENRQRNLANATISNKETHQDLERALQDFYMQTIPTAIGVVGSFATVLATLRGNTGTVMGSFLKFAPVLIGLGAAFFALQTNFLGITTFFQDLGKKIGDAVPAFKPLLNVIQELFALIGIGESKKGGLNSAIGKFKQSFEPIIQGFKDFVDAIMKGNWSGAFNVIKNAALKMWAEIKIAIPLLGDIESLIEKIRGGNWKGAFLQIWVAAKAAWSAVKSAIPILGDIETVINNIKEGKWGEAFQKIVDVAKEIFKNTFGKGIAFLLGDNWQLGLEAFLLLQENEAKAKKRPLILQYAVTINGWIKAVTGIDIIQWFKDHPLTAVTISFPLGGITFAVDDPTFRYAVLVGAGVIIDALGAALSTGAKLLDPYVAQLVKLLNWNTAVTAAREAILTAGQAIWDTIFQGIKGGIQGQDWMKLFTDFGAGVIEAWKVNMPETQKGIESAWNDSMAKKGLDWLGIFFTATPVPDPQGPTIIQNGITNGVRGGYKVPLSADAKQLLGQDMQKVRADIGKKPATVNITANLAEANAKWQAFMKKVRSTQVTIGFGGSGNMRTGSQAGAYGGPRATGFHGLITGPTPLLVGERGSEQVDITPRADLMNKKQSSGTGTITVVVPVMLNGKQIAEVVANEISVNQGVYR